MLKEPLRKLAPVPDPKRVSQGRGLLQKRLWAKKSDPDFCLQYVMFPPLLNCLLQALVDSHIVKRTTKEARPCPRAETRFARQGATAEATLGQKVRPGLFGPESLLLRPLNALLHALTQKASQTNPPQVSLEKLFNRRIRRGILLFDDFVNQLDWGCLRCDFNIVIQQFLDVFNIFSVAVDGQQRFASFHWVAHFFMEFQTDCVV